MQGSKISFEYQIVYWDIYQIRSVSEAFASEAFLLSIKYAFVKDFFWVKFLFLKKSLLFLTIDLYFTMSLFLAVSYRLARW